MGASYFPHLRTLLVTGSRVTWSGYEGVWVVAKAAEPKKQHYVPRFYLRRFTGQKGKLFAVNRPTGHSFRPSPEGVAAENFFNRIEVEGTGSNELEKVLAEFEGEMAPALERVKEAKSLAKEEDRAHLVNLMAALALRNPSIRAALTQIHDQLARLHFVAQFGTKAAVDEAIAAGMLPKVPWHAKIPSPKLIRGGNLCRACRCSKFNAFRANLPAAERSSSESSSIHRS
jgi:hypothetical protein